MVRFSVILVGLLGLNLVCQGQLNSDWQISCAFGISERNSKLNPSYEITESFNPEIFLNYWNNIEEPSLSYMLDCRKVHGFNDRLGFVFGANLSSLGRKFEQEATDNIDDPRLEATGVVVFGDYDFLKVRRRDFFASVPLGIHYSISKNKSWYIQGTINPVVYVTSKSKTIYERIDEKNSVSKSLDRKSSFSDFNLMPELLVGRYMLKRQKRSLSLAFFGQWMMLSGFESDSPYIQRRYFTGLKLGLHFSKI